MKIVILNGSLPDCGDIAPFQAILEEQLKNSFNQLETFVLHRQNIGTCIGCFRCWDQTPGECFQKDDGRAIVKKIIQSDLVIFLTPLTFGGYSSELKKIIERSLGILQPGMRIVNGESHHIKRYERYPSVLSLAVADRPQEEEIVIFKKLGERHSLNFYPPRHRSTVLDINLAQEGRRQSIRNILLEMEAVR